MAVSTDQRVSEDPSKIFRTLLHLYLQDINLIKRYAQFIIKKLHCSQNGTIHQEATLIALTRHGKKERLLTNWLQISRLDASTSKFLFHVCQPLLGNSFIPIKLLHP